MSGQGLAFSSTIKSDAAPLNHLIADVLAASPDTRCFRDPTRGGLASTLNEFAQASGVAMEIDEDDVPVRPDVQAACEMLGYVVLQVANEGKMVCVVPADEAEALQMLTALQGRRHTVCTGVTVRQGKKALTRAQHTDVYFRPATQRELKAYIAGGEPMDKAGAYGVQGQGALLVERIDGDFFNVMGLPVVLLAEMLGEFGIQLLG